MMQKFIDNMEPVTVCRLGGAGNKVNRIALGEVESYVQPRPGLGFWDICAPETIVKAMGGVCYDLDGKRLVYDKELSGGNTTLPAFIITKTLPLYKLIVKRLSKM